MLKQSKQKNFSTDRLNMRPLLEIDFAEWKKANQLAHPPMTRFDEASLSSRQLTKFSFLKFLSNLRIYKKKIQLHHFGIFLISTGELVGYVMIFCVVPFPFSSATLGCRIFNHQWRNGYGKEALSAALDWGHRKLNLHRIECPIEPQNKPSIEMCTSCGMTNEGLSRKKMWIRDKWRDTLMFVSVTKTKKNET